MRLFLSTLVAKAKKPDLPEGDGHTSPSGDQHATGENRGGGYVARARIGTEKDGSPMYRYFRDMDAYRIYLGNKGKEKRSGRYGKNKNKEWDSDLEDKVKKEEKKTSRQLKQKRKETLDEKKLYLKDKKGKK